MSKCSVDLAFILAVQFAFVFFVDATEILDVQTLIMKGR